MFIRKKKNTSGTMSIQIIDKSSGIYRFLDTLNTEHKEKVE